MPLSRIVAGRDRRGLGRGGVVAPTILVLILERIQMMDRGIGLVIPAILVLVMERIQMIDRAVLGKW